MNPPSRRREQPPEPPTVSGVGRFLDEHRAGLASIVVVAAAVLGGWMAWSRLGERVRGDADLVLHADAIELEGVAPWIRGDLKLEALRDASLADGLPLDDSELVRRLARAFAMHPWVREVVSVNVWHPAGARVQVRCREPVAMVGVPGGLLAVDAEGVVLPSDDFTAEAAAAYPKISGVGSGPQGTVGFPWGDLVVEQGAALAAALGPDWQPLGLVECRPVLTKGGDVQAWHLIGAEGRTIVFGSAPGHERAGEPTAAAKIARLRSLPKEAASKTTVDLTVEPETPPVVPSIPTG
ncbi:MAG: hypothetical protein K8S94_03805 [Planctomycetia bacterium]|nr:hypothetical protein [Planctomycetia bacterium]